MYKLLVVDDEPIIREGIRRFIAGHPTGFTVAGEAASGKEALELLPELLPDVIITDICMPTLNGIELIEQAQTVNPDVKVIIVSGYDDFEYAQKAVRLGVFDYLLKPVAAAKLMEALGRVKEELEQRGNLLRDLDELKRRVRESLPVLRDRFFHDLIVGKVAADGLEQRLTYLDLKLAGRLYAVALLKVKTLPAGREERIAGEGLLQCSLVQIAESVFPVAFKPHCFFLSGDKLALLFAMPDGDRQRAFIALNQNLQRTVIAVQRHLALDAYAALGGLYDSLPQIQHSYAEAKEALRFSLLNEKSNVTNFEDIHTGSETQCARPVELERQLLSQVKLGERQAAQQTAAMLLGYYRGLPDIKPARFKQMLFEIAVLMLRMVEEAGGIIKNVTRDEAATPYDLIHRCETFQDLQQFLTGFTLSCLAEIEKVRAGKGYTLVEKAKEMIDAALSDNELAMDQIAARLFISPNYLRSLFKQQVGESFVEYVTRMRMERARALLDDATLKIYDIAALVGYVDQHYFSICFKKYFGLTPTDYRELQRLRNP
jgi:two-component system response regulator YesN